MITVSIGMFFARDGGNGVTEGSMGIGRGKGALRGNDAMMTAKISSYIPRFFNRK